VNDPVLGAAGIVVDNGALLLVQRGRPPGLGRWAVPGGRIEFGERARAAVAREVFEETGVVVEVGEFAGWVERIGGVGTHFVILDFFATPVPSGQTPVAGDDASAARWVPLAEVTELDLVEGLHEFLVQVGSLAPWPPPKPW
jgi:8-oxo-dGTP diphosphatase